MKKIFLLSALLLFIFPTIVNADRPAGYDTYPTTDERKPEYDEFLDSIPNTSLENDGYHIVLPFDLNNLVEPNLLTNENLDDYCKASFCSFYDGENYVYYKDSEESRQTILAMNNASITNDIVYRLIKEDLIRQFGNNNGTLELRVDLENKTMTIKFLDYDQTEGYRYISERVYKYSNEEMNQENLDKAREIVQSMDLYYETRDLSYINNLMNYGGVDELLNGESNVVLFQYPEIKRILEQNPEFEYELSNVGGLGDNDKIFSTAVLYIKKDGVIYSSKLLAFVIRQLIFVDENEEGTLVERATNRIKNYINDSKEFTITETGLPYGAFSTEIDDTEYPVLQTEIQIEGFEASNYLHIIEVPSIMIELLEIQSLDSETGIEIITSGYEVPVDAMITAEDMKNAENINSLLTHYNYQMIDAYNIDIIGRKGNSKVKTIENGVTVFIPVKGYNEGDVITIRHIKDDGTLGEELQGTVVKKAGKLYAKFITTHFSTYALVETSIDNPPTNDSIVNYVMTFIVSLSMMIGTTILYKKTINN